MLSNDAKHHGVILGFILGYLSYFTKIDFNNLGIH